MYFPVAYPRSAYPWRSFPYAAWPQYGTDVNINNVRTFSVSMTAVTPILAFESQSITGAVNADTMSSTLHTRKMKGQITATTITGKLSVNISAE